MPKTIILDGNKAFAERIAAELARTGMAFGRIKLVGDSPKATIVKTADGWKAENPMLAHAAMEDGTADDFLIFAADLDSKTGAGQFKVGERALTAPEVFAWIEECKPVGMSACGTRTIEGYAVLPVGAIPAWYCPEFQAFAEQPNWCDQLKPKRRAEVRASPNTLLRTLHVPDSIAPGPVIHVSSLAAENEALRQELRQRDELVGRLSEQVAQMRASGQGITVTDAFARIKASMLEPKEQGGDGYAWCWLCNLAVAMQNEGVTHEQSNRAAARFLRNLFDVDVTGYAEWQSFERMWAEQSPPAPPGHSLRQAALVPPNAAALYKISAKDAPAVNHLPEPQVYRGTNEEIVPEGEAIPDGSRVVRSGFLLEKKAVVVSFKPAPADPADLPAKVAYRLQAAQREEPAVKPAPLGLR